MGNELEKIYSKSGFDGCLYFDETNNFRKLYISQSKTNTNNVIENISFVLGGLGCVVVNKTIDYTKLLAEFKLKNVAEFKFKTIVGSKMGFLDVLKSNKLNQLLNYLKSDMDYIIHFHTLNYTYFMIVDIVDEALEVYGSDVWFCMHEKLKSILYEAIKPYINDFVLLLCRYNYPNVENDKIKEFSEMIMEFVEQLQFDSIKAEDDFFAKFLQQILKAMRKKGEFIFLSNNDDGEILNDYFPLYISQILTFTKAKLFFDEELVVNGNLTKFSELKRKNNYKFVDSKNEPFIQISDVLVGFFSKIISYLEQTNEENLLQDILFMNSIQKETLKSFFVLQDRSDAMEKLFFSNIQPYSIREKLNILYQFVMRTTKNNNLHIL